MIILTIAFALCLALNIALVEIADRRTRTARAHRAVVTVSNQGSK